LVVARCAPPALDRRTAMLICLPVVVGLGLTPAVSGRAASVGGAAQSLSGLPSRIGEPSNPLLRPSPHPDVTLLQILSAEQQVGGVPLAGRRVVVTAMVAGPARLARAVTVCCAADARTLTVPTTGSRLPATGEWVSVSGTLRVRGDAVVLQVTSVRPVPTPSDPFL
jgi:hypothetical protein